MNTDQKFLIRYSQSQGKVGDNWENACLPGDIASSHQPVVEHVEPSIGKKICETHVGDEASVGG